MTDLPWIFGGLAVALALLVPLALKWDLGISRVLPAIGLIGISSGLLAGRLGQFWHWPLAVSLAACGSLCVLAALTLLLWRFFRDPERTPPDLPGAILAPADGKIIYIKPIEKGEVPFSNKKGRTYSLGPLSNSSALPEGGFLIGTAMSFLDVHVNRSPIAGTVTLLNHIPGLFLSLRRLEAVIQNERVLSVIEGPSFKVGLVQIASRLVRNIVPFCKPGNTLQCGERIGMIRFGSQVDLVLPKLDKLTILVRPGQNVKAGETIIAMTQQTGGQSHAL
ncbi:MAG: phosphatidylserine decarboxylase [Kiritimatiellia bacterium]